MPAKVRTPQELGQAIEKERFAKSQIRVRHKKRFPQILQERRLQAGFDMRWRKVT